MPYAPLPGPVDFSSFVPPGQPDLLAPARRAGLLMIVLGVLVALMGACNGGSAALITPEQVTEQQATMRELGVPDSPIKPETQRIGTMILGGLTLLVGILFVVNGVYVRGGRPRAITTGLCLTGAVTLLVGGLFLMCLIALLVAPVVAGAMLCVLAIPLGLLVWLLIWLIGAARNNSQLSYLRQQYQAQFYQYQHNQQAYAAYAGGLPYPAAGYSPVGYPPAGYGPGYGQPPASQPPSPPAPQSAPMPPAQTPAPPAGGPDEPPAAG
jgi:hypothetical protein